MVRKATRKSKKQNARKRNQIILIATEGKNKTEKTYFNELNREIKGINIVPANGNNTDPVKIVRDAIRAADKHGINFDYGDKVYAVFDTDFNKEDQITEARADAKKNGIELILSNPCFEIWLLQHFRFSTHGYQTNTAVIDELKGYWPEYHKNINSFRCISDMTEDAIKKSKRLMEFHDSIDPRTDVEERNPSTNVHKLISLILVCGQ